jgi:hypothetical protein
VARPETAYSILAQARDKQSNTHQERNLRS